MVGIAHNNFSKKFDFFVKNPYPTLTLPLAGEGIDFTPQKVGSKIPPPAKGEVRRG
jgi:hypothetical protein